MIRDALQEAGRGTYDEMDEQAFKEALLREDLGLDSLDLEEIIFYLESDRGFSFEQEELANCQTVGDLIAIAHPK